MRTLICSLAISILALAACGDDDPPANIDAPVAIDAGVIDTPESTADASCFTNPQSHVEIINGCTDAEKIYKTVDLPLLNPDGTLPPLP